MSTDCLNCPDGLHCNCWYAGMSCCFCQDEAPPVMDLTFMHIHAGPNGASTVVRDNTTGQVIEIPGGPFEVIDRG